MIHDYLRWVKDTDWTFCSMDTFEKTDHFTPGIPENGGHPYHSQGILGTMLLSWIVRKMVVDIYKW